MPKSEFSQKNTILIFNKLAEKKPKIVAFFGRKIATSGHSVVCTEIFKICVPCISAKKIILGKILKSNLRPFDMSKLN